MAISAAAVKQLREKTGVGMMDCKEALQQAAGDMEKAIEILRKKGLQAADKRAGRAAGEGFIGSYIHSDGKIGVIVELNCETDFVARNEEFRALGRTSPCRSPRTPRPVCVTPRGGPRADRPARARDIRRERQGQARQHRRKILDGKMNKFFEEVCLIEQPFIKDPDQQGPGPREGVHRQARREHHPPAVQPVRGGRGFLRPTEGRRKACQRQARSTSASSSSSAARSFASPASPG